MATKPYLAHAFPTYFDGEEGTTPPPPAEPTPTPAADGKTFTQADVDKLMANHRQKLQEELKIKTDSLRDTQANLNLTQEEKDALATKLGEVENSLLTQKEISAREREKLQKEKEEALKRATDEANLWKTRHHNTLIENELVKAASIEGQKAFNPSQIVALFGRDAVVNEQDGNLVVQVKVKTVGSDGKPTTLTLEPTAAIKDYAGRPEYLNLFEMPGKDGVGRTKTNFSMKSGEIPTSIKDYKANRDAIISNS